MIPLINILIEIKIFYHFNVGNKFLELFFSKISYINRKNLKNISLFIIKTQSMI